MQIMQIIFGILVWTAKYPKFQLYSPANLYAVASDHDYLKGHPEDRWLEQNSISKITESDIVSIDEKTTGQSKINPGNKSEVSDSKHQTLEEYTGQLTKQISNI